MPLFLSDNRPSYRTVLDRRRKSVRRGRITSVRVTCEDCNGEFLANQTVTLPLSIENTSCTLSALRQISSSGTTSIDSCGGS
jgi:hypothetical protein